jgi:hypothetical protein
MIDVVVTIARVVEDEGVVTEVHRLEFETYEGVQDWLVAADSSTSTKDNIYGLVNSEQLVGEDDKLWAPEEP